MKKIEEVVPALPTAQECIPDNNYYFPESSPSTTITCIPIEDLPKIMIEFAAMHVKAALKAASESKVSGKYERGKGFTRFEGDSQAILESYPLTLII